MPSWPGTLPTAPEWPSYQETPAAQTVRTNMDAGRPAIRQRSTAVAQPSPYTWLMTAAQVATFETFYLTDLGGGMLRFEGLAHPRTGVSSRWRFTDRPQYEWLGPDTWRVTTPLERVP